MKRGQLPHNAFLGLAKGTSPTQQPFRPPKGEKIAKSPHAEAVAAMLLLGKGYSRCLEYLESKEMPVSHFTLKQFETNFVFKLAQDVKDALMSKILNEEADKETKLVEEVVHAQMSYVDSIIELIGDTERQIQKLDQIEKPTAHVIDIKGKYLDRIRFYREKLEKARMESEVEIERRKAIELVAGAALVYLKGRPEDAEEFIKTVVSIGDRSISRT